jgi:hypothetical protein
MSATYAPTSPVPTRRQSNASPNGGSYVRLAGVRTSGTLARNSRDDTSGGDDVRDLIEAAGPLVLDDIAGGLDVSLPEASLRVHTLVAGGCLQQDEWDRYRLAGSCRG